MSMLDLLLFASDPALTLQADDLDVDGLVVDLENRGKDRRQRGHDTDVSAQTVDDLRRIRAQTSLPIVTRINAVGPWTGDEVGAVIGAGTDEVLLPMVRDPQELDQVLHHAEGRVAVGVMVETASAVAQVFDLARRPISRVYVGLNDLSIDRATPNIFQAFADGTVEHVRRCAGAVSFGVAGLTLPSAGSPLPAHHLVSELTRLRCDFTFLRRSFFAAAATHGANEVIRAIRKAVALAAARTPSQQEIDRVAAHEAITTLPEAPWRPTASAVAPS